VKSFPWAGKVAQLRRYWRICATPQVVALSASRHAKSATQRVDNDPVVHVPLQQPGDGWSADAHLRATGVPCCQLGDDHVVDMRVQKTMQAAVVLGGGDDPALRFDRRECRDTRALQ
jgi:hypothetical protein